MSAGRSLDVPVTPSVAAVLTAPTPNALDAPAARRELSDRDANALRASAERASVDVAHARRKLEEVMTDLRSLPEGLKTTVCQAVEEAYDELRVAESHLLEMTRVFPRIEAGIQPAATPPTAMPVGTNWLSEYLGLLMFGAICLVACLVRFAFGQ